MWLKGKLSSYCAATTSKLTGDTVADITAEEGQYPRAIENYEKVAKASMNNNLTKYSVKNYLFKAGIVHLASGVCRESLASTHHETD